MPVAHWLTGSLAALACWSLVSGLDDLFITLLYFFKTRKRVTVPDDTALERAAERRIAIFVPLWKEHQVIGRMLERNLSVIRYRNFDIFAGVYPNDERTARAVADTAERHQNVHMAVCPHNGPTSKGDCLNWIYRRMKQYERTHGVKFDIVVTHDAEDLIHPDAPRLINWYSRSFDMVQVPVLPLPTGIREATHGLYCDEFAEYQQKDIPARQYLGGFLPSNGVGTGIRRAALERLAESRQGRMCDQECLTEDYENGYALHELGCSQIFVPVTFKGPGPVATQEYFPRKLRTAIRQRSRWIQGIVLQSWQRHGWRVPARQLYWFWRDRKGLVGNLASAALNLLFLYGLAEYARGGKTVVLPGWLSAALACMIGVSAVQLATRGWLSGRVYGWRFAAAAPLRLWWGNLVNGAATVAALAQFTTACMRRRSPAWLKTEHDYPTPATAQDKPRIGEVLIRMRCLSMDDLKAALESRPAGSRLGEHLMHLQKLSEEQLYEALSFQYGVPLRQPKSLQVSRLATHAIPAEAARRLRVIPYRVVEGQLHVLTPEAPSAEMARALASYSELDVRFRLMRPHDFEAMAREYLPRAS